MDKTQFLVLCATIYISHNMSPTARSCLAIAFLLVAAYYGISGA